MASKIIFDTKLMGIMSMFDNITHAALKDCIPFDDQYVFIVDRGQMAKAIGKGGSNIKLLERKLKLKVHVAEYADNACQLTANLMYPAKIKDIKEEDGKIFVQSLDHNSRGIMIGRNANNLRRVEGIVKRYFSIDEIKVK